MLRLLLALGAAAGVAATGSVTAQAEDGKVTSFDGTQIAYSFFPAPGLTAGQRAPTLINGPGYAVPRGQQSDATVSAALARGYNVLTFDPRGFGGSTGNVELDGPNYEGRDVQALIARLALEPQVQLDAPGVPRLGMIGASYGGGIQNTMATIDPHISAITPQIAWHSLVSSLDENNTSKGGWGSILFSLGGSSSISSGPAAGAAGRSPDPRITTAFQDGVRTGEQTPADQAFFAGVGPGDAIGRIRIPTLILQGSDDTLFPLNEAIANYGPIHAHGVPVHMVWFCGSLTTAGTTAHGQCLTPPGPDVNLALDSELNWLDRYVKGDRRADIGPGFEWVSDTGVLHGAAQFPPPPGAPVTAVGAGTLAMVPGDTSGSNIAAAPATNAVNVALPALAPATELVGTPTLSLTYSGTSPVADGRAYAQLVNNATHQAVGNQVTPVPLTLDSLTHSLTLPLEAVAVDAVASGAYSLQITDGTNVYFPARNAGVVNFTRIALSVPTVAPGGSSVVAAPSGPSTRHVALACTSRRRILVHLRLPVGARVLGARVGARRLHVSTHRRRRTVVVDLTRMPYGTFTARITLRLANGHTQVITRRFRTCRPRHRGHPRRTRAGRAHRPAPHRRNHR